MLVLDMVPTLHLPKAEKLYGATSFRPLVVVEINHQTWPFRWRSSGTGIW